MVVVGYHSMRRRHTYTVAHGMMIYAVDIFEDVGRNGVLWKFQKSVETLFQHVTFGSETTYLNAMEVHGFGINEALETYTMVDSAGNFGTWEMPW